MWGLMKKILLFVATVRFGKMKEIQILKYFGVNVHNLRRICEHDRQDENNISKGKIYVVHIHRCIR